MLKSITLEITGDQQIICEGCEQRIEKALKTMRGVDKVRANARNQRVEVLHDTAVLEPAAVMERLNKIGYQAKVLASG